MSRDDLRKRLEALNGGPLAKPLAEAPPEPTEPKKRSKRAAKLASGDAVDLAEVARSLNGTERTTAHGLSYLEIAYPVADIEPEHSELCEAFHRLFPPYSARVGQECCVPHATPPYTLFLDLETAGLSAAPVFLIGTLVCEDGQLVIRQYFARTYQEETAILHRAAEAMRSAHLLVTFNGGRFDLPYLEMRATAAGIPWYEQGGHLDLLPASRRRWAGRLPNFKLQTLERAICGRHREDDIPGSEIPAAYEQFVRTGDSSRIGRILEHNRHDLITLVPLMVRLFGTPNGQEERSRRANQ